MTLERGLEPAAAPSSDNKNDNSGLLHAAGVFVRSASFTAEQAVNSVIQDINHLARVHIGELNFVSAPKAASLFSSDWLMQTAGGAAASIPLFIAASKAAEFGFQRIGPSLLGEGASQMLKSDGFGAWALRGSAYEALFHATDDRKPFWSQKIENIAAGAVSFGTFGALTKGLVRTQPFKAELKDESLWAKARAGIAIDTIGGTAAGATDVAAHTLVSGKLPSRDEAVNEILQYGLVAGAAHAIRVSGLNREHLKAETTDTSPLEEHLAAGRDIGAFRHLADARKADGTLSGRLFFVDPASAEGVAPKAGWHNEIADPKGLLSKELARLSSPDKPSLTDTLSPEQFAKLGLTDIHVSQEELSRIRALNIIPDGAANRISGIAADRDGNLYATTQNADGTVTVYGLKDVILHQITEAQAPWAPPGQEEQQQPRVNPAAPVQPEQMAPRPVPVWNPIILPGSALSFAPSTTRSLIASVQH